MIQFHRSHILYYYNTHLFFSTSNYDKQHLKLFVISINQKNANTFVEQFDKIIHVFYKQPSNYCYTIS